MPKTASSMWIRRVKELEISRRRLRLSICALSALALALTAVIAGRTAETPLSSPGLAEAGTAEVLPGKQDLLYDEFLQEFKPLQNNAARRRYLTGQVLAAAAKQRLDPDLLFALIAEESRFDNKAVSSKGARGLGQLMLPTAKEVAPRVIRRAQDLQSVPRNLYATALHLRQLLDERKGNLPAVLRAYHAGATGGRKSRPGPDQYVARVSTYYAYLKTRRAYRQFAAANVQEARAATD